MTKTYGQYVVNTVVAKSTVLETTTPMIVANVLVAVGILLKNPFYKRGTTFVYREIFVIKLINNNIKKVKSGTPNKAKIDCSIVILFI